MTILTLIASFHVSPSILRLLWSDRVLFEYLLGVGGTRAADYVELLRSGFPDATDWFDRHSPVAEHPIERHVTEAVGHSGAHFLITEQPDLYDVSKLEARIIRSDDFLTMLLRTHRRTVTQLLRENPPVDIGFACGLELPNFFRELNQRRL